MEFTINVNVTASPALETLLDKLAALLAPAPPQTVTAPAPQPVAAPQPPAPVTPAPAAPAAPFAPPAPVTPAPVAPVAPPAPVPLAAAPGYTLEQLARAGAELASQGPDKLAAANALLAQFGVQALTQLPKEQFGAFATALRGLGAKI